MKKLSLKKFAQVLLILLLSILMTLILTSCKSQKLIGQTSKTTTTVKDSTYTEYKKVDSLAVLRKADSVKISIPINKITEKPKTVKSKHSTIKISRKGEHIKAECICEEYKKVIELQKEVITQLREINTLKENTATYQVSKISNWAMPLVWVGGAAMLLIMIFIAFIMVKILKPKPF